MAVAWGAWLREPSNATSVHWGAREIDLLDLIVRGMTDGTDPSGPWFWGSIGDRDQRIVEAAELATALWLGRFRLGAALGSARLARVLDWLGQVDGKALYPDNWLLFAAIVAAVRRAFGVAVADHAIDDGLDEVVGWYAGDGWYADGEGPAYDFYTGWAIHWHLLLWAEIDGGRRPRLRALVRKRARRYLADAAHLFAADGSVPRFGRSLAYRFAVAAPFGLAELFGVSPLEPGQSRRLASGAIRRSLEDGAVDPETDWFRLGVGAEGPEVLEGYISRGSLAWASHALVPLGLAAGHPFWAAAEEPLPVELGSGQLPLRGPGFLLRWRNETGETSLLSARSGHADDIPGHDYATQYGKLAYRSGFPFTSATDDGRPAPDDAMVLVSRSNVAHRHRTLAGGVGPGWAWSRYDLPTVDGERSEVPHRISTVIVSGDDFEVRVSDIRPASPVRAVEGSAAIGAEIAAEVERGTDLDTAWARSAGGCVGVRRLAGYDVTVPSRPFGRSFDRNIVWRHSEIPTVAESAASSGRRIVAAAVMATRAGADPVALLRSVSAEPLAGVRGLLLRFLTGDVVAAIPAGHSGLLSVGDVTIHGARLRIVRIGAGSRSFAGESVSAIDGVLLSERSAPVSVRRLEGGSVELVVLCGMRLDREWTGGPLCSLLIEDDRGAWQPAGRLAEPGALPGGLVRSLRRRRGSTFLHLRLER
jgi:hypothetical protein